MDEALQVDASAVRMDVSTRKFMNRRGLIVALLVASTPMLAAQVVLDFKGFPLGGRLEAFKQKFPSFQCRPTQEHQIACDSYRETYAGLDADIILVSFANGKLQGFLVDGTGADKKSRILSALKDKYGEPSSDDNQANAPNISFQGRPERKRSEKMRSDT
jgi:hypothetical protein